MSLIELMPCEADATYKHLVMNLERMYSVAHGEKTLGWSLILRTLELMYCLAY